MTPNFAVVDRQPREECYRHKTTLYGLIVARVGHGNPVPHTARVGDIIPVDQGRVMLEVIALFDTLPEAWEYIK